MKRAKQKLLTSLLFGALVISFSSVAYADDHRYEKNHNDRNYDSFREKNHDYEEENEYREVETKGTIKFYEAGSLTVVTFDGAEKTFTVDLNQVFIKDKRGLGLKVGNRVELKTDADGNVYKIKIKSKVVTRTSAS